MKKAFTLIELLVVIAIVAIIAGLVFGQSGCKIMNAPIVNINGCQYIKTYVHGGFNYVYLGNCTNAIHEWNRK